MELELMVIDTSAIIAILFNDPEAEAFARVIVDDSRRLISASTLLETSIVIEARKGSDGGWEWELLRFRANLEVVPLTETQHSLAIEAWRTYGKGRHKANLNIGDCCSYSLAKLAGEPLLYKGRDFSLTDVASALYV
jgi:ribonuclease VapC